VVSSALSIGYRLEAMPPSTTDRPPRYPAEFERRVRLRDGRTVAVRPIVPGDAAELATALATADPETLRRRFLGTPPRVTPALLERLTVVDYSRRFALVAFDPDSERGVAIARYEWLADRVAEIAIAVDPAWRRVGLATALIELLAEAALARGIHEFSAYYLAENRPVEALLGHVGGSGKQLIRQGIAEFVIGFDDLLAPDALPDATGTP
jgi:RimJ/RimL family protein N-acetyltransferase